ncbi:helix-turn-helix transcriptional regulator [Echinimonas agarilytica]|uniref:WYL domain-containing protein n=1 Tax=Echinimonas agarilytica TaxID=1215918 RepID=A0AA41W4T6_9GAMM|nr:WYL domain-containing protein [Echinimonas agarilytica]MCM2678674.1 WYL domain-containing protein [Echinimonas agarilytica]
MDLEQLSHAQKERLAFIDFNLNYFGEVARSDLIQRFKTGLAAATRDFSAYKQLAPDNLVLLHTTKSYHRTAQFKAVFEQNPESVLAGLARGFGDGLSHPIQPSQTCFDAIRLIHPDAEVISTLMRAIHHQNAVSCRYVSTSSGESERQIVPHSLVNNGHRWHVRAFDRRSQTFRDFVCTRFTELHIWGEPISSVEHRERDNQWNRIVDLKLIPHPSLPHTQAIEMDYGMQDGALRLEVRAALAGYLLRQWNVDCSGHAERAADGCQLALAHREALFGVDNLALAPGFSPEP